MLTRQFQIDWLKVTFLGEAETAVRLGIRYWFADVGLSTGDSTLGLLFLSKQALKFLSVFVMRNIYFYL